MKAIIAVNNKDVIGSKGIIPWHSSEDFKHFKNITMGSTLIVGSKTWEDCLKKKMLPGRSMIVVGKNYMTLWDAVTEAIQDYEYLGKDVWVIGGSEIYQQLLPICSELHISHINDDSEGDAWFQIPPTYRGKIFNYYFETNDLQKKS